MEKQIESITVYRDPVEFMEASDAELTGEQRDALTGVWDFEPVAFYVINGELVLTVDTISGDVLSRDTVQAVIDQTIAYCNDELN